MDYCFIKENKLISAVFLIIAPWCGTSGFPWKVNWWSRCPLVVKV